MGNQCASYWLPRLQSKGVTPSWAADYSHLVNDSRSGIRKVREVDLEEVAQDIEGDENRVELEDEEDEIEGDEDDFFDSDNE
jgi:hypothetical protein